MKMDVLITKEQMDSFWKKKEFVSFVLSILVFLIHISSFAQYASVDGRIGTLNGKLSFFFQESITRFAVPMYFILSGIAFFRDYDNTKYIKKLKSRFFTLCIPYLIWNTLCMLFEIICSYTFIAQFYSGRKMFVLSLPNIVNGILFHGCNLPFWYVLYLIVFVVCAPIFYLLVHNKYVSILTTIVLTILSALDMGSVLGINLNAVVFYLFGAILGRHYFADVVKKAGRKKQALSIAFMTAYILMKNVYPTTSYFGFSLIQILVFAMASWSLWNITDLLMENVPHYPIFTRSFAVYAMHINVSAIICKLLYLITNRNAYFALPNFLMTMVLSVTVINSVCDVFERFLPQTYALLMGKGLKQIMIERK